MMVLTLYLYQGHLATKEFQGGKHLQTLYQRYIRVCIAMQQKQRCMNLVGIKQRTLVHIQLTVAPGIAVGHRHLTIVIAPVALSPVAGVIGNTSMTHSSSEDVSLRLQILRHEATIRGTHTTNLLFVDIRMRLTNLLRALNNILSRSTTSRVHMT